MVRFGLIWCRINVVSNLCRKVQTFSTRSVWTALNEINGLFLWMIIRFKLQEERDNFYFCKNDSFDLAITNSSTKKINFSSLMELSMQGNTFIFFFLFYENWFWHLNQGVTFVLSSHIQSPYKELTMGNVSSDQTWLFQELKCWLRRSCISSNY